MRTFDTSLAVQTPEGIEFSLYPAGLLARACALAIDSILTWFLLVVLTFIHRILWGAFGSWIFMLAAFALNWFYHVVFDLAWGGRSIGKRVMGLRVVMADGSPVSPGASFTRNLLRFADVFAFLNLIALLCISFSAGFRRIGDWAGDTLVVYSSGRGTFRGNSGSLAWLSSAAENVVPPRPLSWEEKQAVLMFARRYPLLGPARADEIARDYAAVLKGEAFAGGGSCAYLLGIARGLSGDAP